MDAETCAAAIRREAGVDGDPVTLARAILGPQGVLLCARAPFTARYQPAYDSIWVSRSVPASAVGFGVAHELAERHLRRVRWRGDEREREALCDATAAALTLPRDDFRATLRAVGRDLAQLASLYRASQSVTALRIGEVTSAPVVLVTPRHVHVRGDPWAWPCEEAVRRLVRGPLPAGVVRLEITDAPRRWALAAA